MSSFKKIELLAPAGDLESFYSAVNSGCDAVYLSGGKFGARAYAKNFSNDEIKEAIRYAHLLDVKVYVTVNTLIKDSEINEVLNFVNFLYKNHVDAILIQDIGLAHILRNIFPSLVLHASTQMNVHSVDEARKLKKLGFKRIVLARECDIDLIKKIKKEVDIEIEVFAHGALCMSNSGQCYISSLIGKRSGNRGRCGGACRLSYSLVKGENKEEVSDKAYFLSLKDLYTLDKVKELIDSGVDSLKIEGRLKKKEYVSLVTKSYKEAIDGTLDENKRKYQLQEMFNREFTCGHIFKEHNSMQTNTISPNHIGIRIGKTVKVYKNTVYIKLDSLPKWDNLELGDSIRIKNANLEDGITLNRIDICDDDFNVIRRASEAKKANIIKIDSHINLCPNMEVLKTSTKKLIDEFSNVSLRKRAISGLIFECDNRLALKLKCDDIEVVSYSDSFFEKSNNEAMKDRIKEQISKINNTCFYFSDLKNEISNVFLPIKEINELRRKAIILLEEAILNKNSKEYKLEKFKSSVNEYTNDFTIYCKVRTKEQYDACVEMGIKNIISEEEELKDLDNIIFMNPRNALVDSGITNDKKISSVYKNIFNAYAVHFMHKMGIEKVGISIELSKNEIEGLIYNYRNLFKHDPNLLMMVYGHYELMLMKHCLINKFYNYKSLNCKECLKNQYYLKDKMDYMFPLIRGNKCSLKLLNSRKLHLIKYLKDIKEMGINNILLDFTIEDYNEVLFVIENYINSIEGRIFIRDIENATYGHYKEEIE